MTTAHGTSSADERYSVSRLSALRRSSNRLARALDSQHISRFVGKQAHLLCEISRRHLRQAMKHAADFFQIVRRQIVRKKAIAAIDLQPFLSRRRQDALMLFEALANRIGVAVARPASR